MAFAEFLGQVIEQEKAFAHSDERRFPIPDDARAYGEVLASLGLLDIDDERSARFVSDDARRFAESMQRSLQLSHLPLGDFRTSGADLPWVRALAAMERDRPSHAPKGDDEEPEHHLREQNVEQLLMIGLFGDRRYVLFEIDFNAADGWSMLKLPSTRSEFDRSTFFDDLENTLGSSSRAAGFIDVVKDEEVIQISRSHGSLTRYLVTVRTLSSLPSGMRMEYPSARKRIGWMDIADFQIALRSRRDQLFPKIFELDAVIRAIGTPELPYALEPRDLEGRRLQRVPSEEWDLS
jgi:hypothetical protein